MFCFITHPFSLPLSLEIPRNNVLQRNFNVTLFPYSSNKVYNLLKRESKDIQINWADIPPNVALAGSKALNSIQRNLMNVLTGNPIAIPTNNITEQPYMIQAYNNIDKNYIIFFVGSDLEEILLKVYNDTEMELEHKVVDKNGPYVIVNNTLYRGEAANIGTSQRNVKIYNFDENEQKFNTSYVAYVNMVDGLTMSSSRFSLFTIGDKLFSLAEKNRYDNHLTYIDLVNGSSKSLEDITSSDGEVYQPIMYNSDHSILKMSDGTKDIYIGLKDTGDYGRIYPDDFPETDNSLPNNGVFRVGIYQGECLIKHIASNATSARYGSTVSKATKIMETNNEIYVQIKNTDDTYELVKFTIETV